MAQRARHMALWPRRMMTSQAKHTSSRCAELGPLLTNQILVFDLPETEYLREAMAPAGSSCPLSVVRLCFTKQSKDVAHHFSAPVRSSSGCFCPEKARSDKLGTGRGGDSGNVRVSGFLLIVPSQEEARVSWIREAR